ncbi:uncharacterized protein [Malus domestica]|uniref:uncharacterized protein n=1 Tax=Malus domestica TaxID=3750 RepID=UPI0039767E5F
MHDRALMQLITATLSSVAISCAIGSISARDLWVRLQERFSMVSKTSIFQLKSDLQTIKKGADSMTQYLQRIKKARDYLAAAGVNFDDEDIVILALNGLSAEYNTFRCVIRGRENVISLEEFRAQLLAEEAIIKNSQSLQFSTALFAKNQGSNAGVAFSETQGVFNSGLQASNGFHGNSCSSHFFNNGHRSKYKGKGKAGNFQGQKYFNNQGQSFIMSYVNYVLNKDTVLLLTPYMSPMMPVVSPNMSSMMNMMSSNCASNLQPSAHMAISSAYAPAYMYASTSNAPALSNFASPQVWLTNSGATNHMTNDFSNLSLASPYPTNETIQQQMGKDKTTGRILYKGLYNNSLYPIPSFPRLPSGSSSHLQANPPVALLGHTVNSTLCALSSKSQCSQSQSVKPDNNTPILPIVMPTFQNILVSPSSTPSLAHEPSHSSQSSSSSQFITAQDSPASVVPDHNPESLQVVLDVPPLNLHPMQTHSKSGIVKKKVFFAAAHTSTVIDLTTTEPATYKSALKVPVWLNAMNEELNALYSQKTWSLVDLPPNKNLVGCKWIFKVKKNADGSIARHKARLVAKGFSQEAGLNYGETFSPVVKPTTVRLILALAAHYN